MNRLLVAGLVGVTGLFAVGCQTSDRPAQSSLTETPQGVRCDKCQTTWVNVPNYQSGRIGHNVVAYSTQKQHACPDCRTAVQTFFESGKLQHSCKTCGGDMSICEAH